MTAALTDRTVRLKFRTRVRTLFISDVHLGTRGPRRRSCCCSSSAVRSRHALPGGRHRRLLEGEARPVLGAVHNDVLQKLLRLVRKGARLIYIPGNHDDASATTSGSISGGWWWPATSSTTTADGRRYLVIHGDEFDGVVRPPSGWPFWATGLRLALWLNNPMNRCAAAWGSATGRSPPSSSIKRQIGRAFIGTSRRRWPTEAGRRGVDGIICGHIHHAAERTI